MIDYSTWSSQRLFNKVSRHLLTQNKKALNGDECICWDFATNRRCAVGSLLPISFYKKEGDKTGSRVLFLCGIEYCTVESNLMGVLQNCHDTVKPSRWPSALRRIARDAGLKIPQFLQEA